MYFLQYNPPCGILRPAPLAPLMTRRSIDNSPLCHLRLDRSIANPTLRAKQKSIDEAKACGLSKRVWVMSQKRAS